MALKKEARSRCAAGQGVVCSLAVSLTTLFSSATLAAPATDPLDDEDDAQITFSANEGQKSVTTAAPGKTATAESLSGSPARPMLAIPEGGWVVPPMPWQAQFGVDFDRSRVDSNPASGAMTTRLNGNSSTFILAPWFVNLNGAAGFTRSKTTLGSESDSASGTLNANILSQSQYPATIGVSSGVSSLSSFGTTSRSEFQNFFWAQQYMPSDAAFKSNLTYRLNSAGASIDKTTSQSLEGDVQFRVQGDLPQTLSLGGAANRTASSSSPAGSELRSANANHSVYFEDYVLTLTSNASLSQILAKGAQDYENRFVTVGSQMDWIPSDDYPLRLTGSGRHQEYQNRLGQSSNRTSSTTLNMLATYPMDKNWSFSGNGALARTLTGSDQASAYVLGISAGWGGDGLTKPLGAWAYALGYGSSASANYQGSSIAPPNWVGSVSATVNQSVVRRFEIDPKAGASSLNVVQSVSTSKRVGDDVGAANISLSHNAGYQWSQIQQANSSLTASFSASDGRSFGASRSQFQNLSGSLNGSHQLNPRESLSFGAGTTYSRQGSEGAFGAFSGGASANLGYRHARFADVPGLAYSVVYTTSISPQASKRNDLGVNQNFSQSWSWRLGLLSWKMANDIARDSGGSLFASIRLSISRDFGGVL